jgi:hypothetical protein
MIKGSEQLHDKLAVALGQTCQQHLSDAFKKFFQLAASQLPAMAMTAKSNRLQTLFYDAQRVLRSQRAVIESAAIQSTQQHVFTAFNKPVNREIEDYGAESPSILKARSLEKRDGDNLKLVDDDDLEMMIALDNCSSRVREQLKADLYQLEGRFQSLVGTKVSIKTLPLSPDALLEGFVTAIAPHIAATDVQLTLVGLFDQAFVATSYGQMLAAANQLLDDAGVMVAENPDKLDGKKRPRSAVNDEPAEYEYDQANGGPMQPSRVQTQLLTRIASLLENTDYESAASSSATMRSPLDKASAPHNSAPEQGKRANAAPTDTGTEPDHRDGRACLDRTQLFDEINTQFHKLLARGPQLASHGQLTRELAAMLNHSDAGHSRGRLHRNDQSVFQVVGNAFAQFGAAAALAPEVQQVINRCEVPMLKLALKKPLVLEQESHPIRRLFNEMAKYAIGLEQGDCEDNKIYQQMLKMSESMLEDGFGEQDVPRLLSEFMALIDRDRQVTSMLEEREIEKVSAQEKVNWARTRVEEEITKRLLGKHVPEFVVEFVQRNWCMVLHIAHLRSGEGGADWIAALVILDRLIDLAQCDVSDGDWHARHDLLTQIKTRLTHISTDLAQRSLQLQQLKQALGVDRPLQPLSEAGVATISPINPAMRSRQERHPARLAEEKAVAEVKRVLVSAIKLQLPGHNIAESLRDAESLDSESQQCLRGLQKGCWIELGGDIKAHKRGKLAGIVGPSWKYVFVDHKGKLIAERDRARLALDIMQGKVTVLDNSHLFDKAIKQAITQIKGLPVAS